MKPVTQWFDPDMKPVHLGLYESCISCLDPESDANLRAMWDGNDWVWVVSGIRCEYQNRIWRGLADKPGA